MSYRLFTDATADMSADILRDIPEITILPMEVMFGDEVLSFTSGEDPAVSSFYGRLRAGETATTSQINIDVFLHAFEAVLAAGEDILYLCFTSQLSGMINSAHLAIEQLSEQYPDRRIICIDTLCASVEEGFLVHEAACRYRDGMSMDALAAWVEEHKTSVWQWFSVNSMTHLLHGGRVGRSVGTIGDALQIKPILQVTREGSLKLVSKARGRMQAMRKMLSSTDETIRTDKGNLMIIGHGDCPDDAEKLKSMILETYPDADVRISTLGPIIGAHVGPEMLAIVYWGDVR